MERKKLFGGQCDAMESIFYLIAIKYDFSISSKRDFQFFSFIQSERHFHFHFIFTLSQILCLAESLQRREHGPDCAVWKHRQGLILLSWSVSLEYSHTPQNEHFPFPHPVRSTEHDFPYCKTQHINVCHHASHLGA